ncbi:MAG: hypothetical protein V2A54_11415 [Bacteroidota bacterium]
MNKKEQPKKPMTPEQLQMANAKLMDHLQKQNFGSIEEVQEFLKKNMTGKPIDEIVPVKKGKLTKKEKADELMYQAYETDSDKGKQLAEEALMLNPSNLNAMIYLADLKESAEEAIALYKQAMDIAEKEWGSDFMEESRGHFWLINETRPYMTAKLSYADCLHAIGKEKEAIKEYNELLELNPNDSQGVRFILNRVLLQCRKYNEFEELLKKYDDEPGASWLFNYALFLFETKGPSADAYRALSAADKANRHVIPFITAQKKITTEPDGYFSPGDEREATYYLMENLYTWQSYPGTLDWIFNYLERKKKKN